MKKLNIMLEDELLPPGRTAFPVTSKSSLLRHRKKFRHCVMAVTAMVVWAGMTTSGLAISWWWQSLQQYYLSQDLKAGTISQRTFDESWASLQAQYDREHTTTTVGVVGTITSLTTTTVTFNWGTGTSGGGTVLAAGPAIGSVEYFAQNPNGDPSLFSSYSLIGTSTDVADLFAFSLTTPPGQFDVLAIPYDPSGIMINIPDPVYDASAPAWATDVAMGLASVESVPDSSNTLALLGVGILSLLAYDWRRKAKA